MGGTVKVIIERAENNFSAYLESIDGIAVCGASIDQIKERMQHAISLYVRECKKAGAEIPEHIQGDYELAFKMDVKSLLEFYSGIFSKAGLERITGIHQKQLWHYASGGRKPRQEQALRLERALHKLGNELLSINL